MDNEGTKSRYQKIEKPVFQSKIPDHLLRELDAKERYLLEQVSQLSGKADWLIDQALESNRIVIETDARLAKVEDWKSTVSGKGAVVVGAVALVFTAFVSAGVRLFLESLFGSKHP